jgi:thymidine phosphorylase
MVATLGGPADFIDRPARHLPKTKIVEPVKADRNGFVSGIETRDIGLAVVALGGGRTRPQDSVDHAVGITGLLPVGAEVRPGDALALVHARSAKDAQMAIAAVRAAYVIGNTRPAAKKAIIRRVGAPS